VDDGGFEVDFSDIGFGFIHKVDGGIVSVDDGFGFGSVGTTPEKNWKNKQQQVFFHDERNLVIG